MKLVQTNIKIGSLEFDFVHEMETVSGWELLTDTASIKLPSKLHLDKDAIKDIIKKGDAVEIATGYDDLISTVFKGVVSEVTPSTPIEILCQDEMWNLKQIKVSISFPGGKLLDLLQQILPSVQIDCFDVTIGPFRANNINAAKLLDHIKSDFGLYSFFRNGVLTIGKQYDPQNATTHKFKLDFNILSDDLRFTAKDDVRLKVRAISNNPNGTKTEIEIGDEDGDVRTLNFYDVPATELKKIAENEMDRLRYDGWRGSFTSFGEPMVKHGDIVELEHETESDKTGSFWIDEVVVKTGLNGIRQVIKLGPAA